MSVCVCVCVLHMQTVTLFGFLKHTSYFVNFAHMSHIYFLLLNML